MVDYTRDMTQEKYAELKHTAEITEASYSGFVCNPLVCSKHCGALIFASGC